MGGGLKSALNILHDIVSIDSNDSIRALGTESGRVEVSDVILYGSKDMENEDCVGGVECSACVEKAGIFLPVFG